MPHFDELAGKPIGRRIQVIRERRGMSHPVVAGLIGRTPDWLKKIETGVRQPPRLDMLIRLAEVLGVQDITDLTGDRSEVTIGMLRRESHDAVPAIREAIEETLFAISDVPPPGVEDLSQRTAQAWTLWHTSPSPRTDVGRVLPQLIRDGRHAARILEGNDRRRAHAALSSTYALSEQVLAWVSDPALLWLSADRCMAAAEQADAPDILTGAAWVLGNVWRATGREEDALRLVIDAADLLVPHLNTGSNHIRAMWGACHLHAAITAARLGREGDALRYLDDADKMVSRLPRDYAHPWTLFGRPNTDLTGVSVHVDLHKGGTALDEASIVDPDAVPSVDRRARLWLETARAYAQKEDYTSTLHVLQRATAVSTESMRCHPLSRSLAGELITTGGRLIEREARTLATQLGVLN